MVCIVGDNMRERERHPSGSKVRDVLKVRGERERERERQRDRDPPVPVVRGRPWEKGESRERRYPQFFMKRGKV